MLNLYPITTSNAPLWLLLIAFAGVALWHLVPVLFRGFVPKGYKYDSGMDAIIPECASLAYPSDSGRIFVYDPELAKDVEILPKSTTKNCKPRKATTKAKKATPKKGTAMRKKK